MVVDGGRDDVAGRLHVEGFGVRLVVRPYRLCEALTGAVVHRTRRCIVGLRKHIYQCMDEGILRGRYLRGPGSQQRAIHVAWERAHNADIILAMNKQA